MNFTSFSEFLNMGGHGLYVWLCYSVAFVIFIIIFVQPILGRKSLLRELSQIQRRNTVAQDLKSSVNSNGESINEA